MNSLKELLYLKTINKDLRDFIMQMDVEQLKQMVVTSLSKMGMHGMSDSKGRRANPMIVHFGSNASRLTTHALRSALSHHLSRYRAALAAGDRVVADKHLYRIVPLIDLAAKAAKYSDGRLELKAENPMAWEMNYSTDERREDGRFKRDPEGWKVRASKYQSAFNDTLDDVAKLSNIDISSAPPRSIINYRFFELPAHPGYRSGKKVKESPYPWHEIQVGSTEDILSDSAYIPIDYEVKHEKGKFIPHPFDSHPIVKWIDAPSSKITESDIKNYLDDLDKWHESESYGKLMQNVKSMLSSGTKFSKPPKNIYDDIPEFETQSKQFLEKLRSVRPVFYKKPSSSAPEALETPSSSDVSSEVKAPEMPKVDVEPPKADAKPTSPDTSRTKIETSVKQVAAPPKMQSPEAPKKNQSPAVEIDPDVIRKLKNIGISEKAISSLPKDFLSKLTTKKNNT